MKLVARLSFTFIQTIDFRTILQTHPLSQFPQIFASQQMAEVECLET